MKKYEQLKNGNETSESFFLIFQKNLDDVQTKFRRFQKPADFEPKMAHVKEILDSVMEGIGVLELRNGEPEVIQTQLDACMVRSRGCIQGHDL